MSIYYHGFLLSVTGYDHTRDLIIELEWPGPPAPKACAHIEFSTTSVDDPEMQLGKVYF